MEITFIGIVVIILSIIAFFKDEDWLLGLTMFFSTFVAASAINIYTTTTAIVPFEIPLVLWIIRKFINIIKNRKSITKERIRKLLIENKIFSALLIITVTMILSEIWLLISNIEYTFYDPTYYENRTISFSSSNITQLLRVICFLVFAMLLSIDINDKGKIRKLLKIFATSTIFAVVWGFIQFILYYIKIDYPSYLFNNNPWYSQCVDQVMRGIKRINSIGTEPSVFALNLLAAIPIMLILWLFDREKQSGTFRIINDILIISVITCAVLTTSSTVVVGLISIIGTLLLYLLVNYKKNNKAFKYKKMLKSMMFSALVILVIFIISIGFYEIIKSLNNNVVKEQVSKTDINFLETLKEMTISKLSSGSGRQRAEREVIGFRIYSISPIFGVGFGSFRTFTLFTNVLVNMGILGLLSLLYLIYIVLRTIIANRKKDEKYFLIFLLSIIGMLSAFFVSIPDLIYIYFWSILVLAYKYFTINDTQSSVNKDSLNIGIDGRALNKEKAGIGTYTYEIIKELNELDETNMYYIYSNKKIYIDFELKSM